MQQALFLEPAEPAYTGRLDALRGVLASDGFLQRQRGSERAFVFLVERLFGIEQAKALTAEGHGFTWDVVRCVYTTAPNTPNARFAPSASPGFSALCIISFTKSTFVEFFRFSSASLSDIVSRIPIAIPTSFMPSNIFV